VSLPKGGGAIRDIGEKFSVSAATGTASLTVPVATSPGRAGFGPSLSLSYDSGAGNGPFGLGWKISHPAITRKTDKGLPRYIDDPDADTFILAGAEDLVPVRTERDGAWHEAPARRAEGGRDYLVQRYRPRIEGLFARIERWRDLGSGETHWRTITNANVTTVYGATAASRIADPADPSHVFSWLCSATYDDTGNAAVYDYLPEDSAGVDTALPSERNRTARSRSANRYLKRIRYGNREPWRPDGDAIRSACVPHGEWLFETVFDYGDHREDAPLPEPDRAWPARSDPFSTYRPGFEVRTYRRCHRVLMFHHFPGEPGAGADCLVSSTDLAYASTGGSAMTAVASVTHTGYRRRDGGYHAASLPPLELRYSSAVVGTEVRDLSPEALANLPAGVDGTAYQWVDLDGEGLSGILARQGGAWYYKPNLGGGRFAAPRMLATQPAMAGPGSRQELLDLAGDGHLDLAELGGPMPGCYQRTEADGWQPFRPFRSRPNISWDNPDLRMVDLDGDGLADVLITGDDAFTWYPSLGLDGFGDGQRAFSACPWSEERGPRLMLADPEQTIYLADMSGDGLSDLVRVRNGEVCYWPSTGFGRFGAKVTMDRSPWMDQPGHFDQRRVRLADVDGTGIMDLIYLHPDGTRVYLNQSGNGYGEPHTLPHAFPQLDSLAHVMVADLLGHGTACLLWSSPLPVEAGRQVRYVDLMTAGKPYLLTEVINNLGAETLISYAPSTQFYLADQAAGRPWITRLPFPVQVVERVDTIDRVNRNKFTTRHAYHHGYFDGFEREFRGFGMVEHLDTEDLAVLEANPGGFANLDRATDLPPVLTRTWLHTGVFPGDDRVTRLYAREYWRQPGGGAPDLPDTTLPATLRLAGHPPRPWQLSRTEAREACRALKGMPLREEVYALDGTEAEGRPYLVTEHNYTIELLQPAITPVPDGPQNYHAVLLTHARESVTAHYERALYPAAGGEERTDPRIAHDVVLAVDDYGNPLRSASAGYGRRYPDPALAPDDQAAQARLRLTYTENGYTNAVDLPGAHRTPMAAQARTFEVAGLHPAGRLFAFAELGDGLTAVTAELPFQDWDADPADLPAPARRLISHTAVRYRRDDLSGALPLGVLEPLALPYRSYRQAFTDSLVADLYGDQVDARMLRAAGYLREDGTWRLPSGRVFYSPGDDDPAAELDYARRHFFLPHRFTDPFGNTTTISYDRYDLLVRQTRDPLGNLVTAGERDPAGELTMDGNDYRVLAPRLVTDPNRNRATVAFDVLGRASGTAVMGKPEEQLGDSLDGFEPDPPSAAVEAYFADPHGHGHVLLGQATTRVLYDVDAYRRSRGERPAAVAVLARETHVSDLAPGQRTRIQRRFSYSDGFGREIQRKGQAAAGPVTENGPEIRHRWIGSRWTVFNNKGKPVRQYEPFFSATHQFEFARTQGVSPTLFYDPVERVVATLHPNHTYEKVVFDPWQQATWDVNDTVTLEPKADPDVSGLFTRLPDDDYLPTWYQQRGTGGMGTEEQAAAQKAEQHAGTPTRVWLDTLGRTFLTVADNAAAGRYATRVQLDIEGNQRAVIDARGRVVMRYDYDLLGHRIHQASMEAGERWMLNDVAGKPIRSWTGRGHAFRTGYDRLRRPLRSFVEGGQPSDPSGEVFAQPILFERVVHGEQHPQAEALNLRGRPFMHFDSAGVVTNQGHNPDTGTSEAYDFKGNLLHSTRRLARDYTKAVDWSSVDTSIVDAAIPSDPAKLDLPSIETALQPLLDEGGEPYLTSSAFDALNRPIRLTTPDGTVIVPTYNEANLLERIDAHLQGAAQLTPFVTGIDYNAKGQRTLIKYAGEVGSNIEITTTYDYDDKTFRLIRLTTKRHTAAASDPPRFRGDCPQKPDPDWPGYGLQDLHYTYDPIGNITNIRDDAQQTIFFKQQRVEPSNQYTYDAIYRLIEATGREHLGQNAAGVRLPPTPTSYNDRPRIGLPHPNDLQAMGTYRQSYVYDEVGNIQHMIHVGSDPSNPGWTRTYFCEEDSLLEPTKKSNRLTGTTVGSSTTETYSTNGDGYDAHGNMLHMPQLQVMQWDFRDQLRLTQRQKVNDDDKDGDEHRGERAWYVYDAAGQRVRKVTVLPAGQLKDERIYLGAFEVYRRQDVSDKTVVRQTLHIMDDKQRIALVETRTKGDDGSPKQLIRYQLGNHLGSASLELGQQAQVISYEEYYPYGSTSYQAVRSQTDAPKRYRYTTKERDEESGLYYYGARYYAPWFARWVSPDPLEALRIEERQLVNRYSYVLNNPVLHVDPTGQLAVPSQVAEGAKQVAKVALKVLEGGKDAAPGLGTVATVAVVAGVSGYLAITNPPFGWEEPGAGVPPEPTDAGAPLEASSPEATPAQEPTASSGTQAGPVRDADRDDKRRRSGVVLKVDIGRYHFPKVERENIQEKYTMANFISAITGEPITVVRSIRERAREQYLRQWAAEQGWTLAETREALRGVAVDEYLSIQLGGLPQLEFQWLLQERINSALGAAEQRAIRNAGLKPGDRISRIEVIEHEPPDKKYMSRKWDWYAPFNRPATK